jgi:elongator complex protein 3
MRNPIRTLSGVAPISVMIPPRKCPHGTCIYCPSLNSPQSYTPQSPAVLRAKLVDYDSRKQVEKRLEQLKGMSHPTDKVELIIMGGTFLAFPEEFQFNFIKGCYDALNGKISKNLEEAKKLNEKAKQRCVALCIETRPDICGEKEIKNMLDFGCTRVELGVQAMDDKIYEKVNRGHKVADVIQATRLLKEKGFKVGYHIMWGLPGSNVKKDIQMFKELFSNSTFKPDQLKIYPCQVIQGAKIEELFHQKKYKPYTKEQVKIMLLKVFPIIPEYCRVMRIMREIPRSYLVEGISDLGIRGEVEEEIRKSNSKINEIRFREIGFALRSGKTISGKTTIKKTEYEASGGKEIFLQAIDKNKILFGLLRLRLGQEAIVRELHVYGPAAALGEKDIKKFQHKGLGKELLKEAEALAKKNKFKSIKIISGVGVREYYQDLEYELDEECYMVKEI